MGRRQLALRRRRGESEMVIHCDDLPKCITRFGNAAKFKDVKARDMNAFNSSMIRCQARAGDRRRSGTG